MEYDDSAKELCSSRVTGVLTLSLLIGATLLAFRIVMVKMPTSTSAGICIYKITSPLLFGVAKTAVEVLDGIGDVAHTYVFDIDRVLTIDATELVAVESMMHRLRRSARRVIFVGLVPDVANSFRRVGIEPDGDKLAFAASVEIAIKLANAELHPRLATR